MIKNNDIFFGSLKYWILHSYAILSTYYYYYYYYYHIITIICLHFINRKNNFYWIGAVFGFTANSRNVRSNALMAKSKAVPFLEAPKALDGSMAGDKGFDPLGKICLLF